MMPDNEKLGEHQQNRSRTPTRTVKPRRVSQPCGPGVPLRGTGMRWFKHMSDAPHNHKLVKLRELFGMWGVGVYWDLVARVAGQFRIEDPSPSATLAPSELCACYRVRRQKLTGYLLAIERLGLCQVVTNDQIIVIEIPSILKHKDNHTRNLQATCKQEVEVEVEVEKEEEKQKKQPRASGARGISQDDQIALLTRRGVTPQVAHDFIEIRKRKRAPLTETAARGIEKEASKAGMALQEVIEMACARGWQGFKAGWVKDRKQDWSQGNPRNRSVMERAIREAQNES